MPRYVVIIEKGPRNYGAYAPDVPGCVTTGKTFEETQILIEEALILHLQGLAEDHEPIPETISEAVYITVPEPKLRTQESPDPRQLTDGELWDRVRDLKGKPVDTLVTGRRNLVADVDEKYVIIQDRVSKISRKQVLDGFKELKTTGKFGVQKGRPRRSFSWFLVPALLRETLGRDQVGTFAGEAGIYLKEDLAKAS